MDEAQMRGQDEGVWDTFFGPHPYRCSRGHEFARLADLQGHVLDVGEERFCLLCLLPFLRQFCGTVEKAPVPDVEVGASK